MAYYAPILTYRFSQPLFNNFIHLVFIFNLFQSSLYFEIDLYILYHFISDHQLIKCFHLSNSCFWIRDTQFIYHLLTILWHLCYEPSARITRFFWAFCWVFSIFCKNWLCNISQLLVRASPARHWCFILIQRVSIWCF